jgi:hypothetical protein
VSRPQIEFPKFLSQNQFSRCNHLNLQITGDIWLFGKPRVVQHKNLHPEMKMMGKHLKSMKHGEKNVSTPRHNVTPTAIPTSP